MDLMIRVIKLMSTASHTKTEMGMEAFPTAVALSMN
jgi:hypothetical protein